MRPHWFVQGDIDVFFFLFIGNLLQLMVIAVLCKLVGGLPSELITGRILPGADCRICIVRFPLSDERSVLRGARCRL